MYNENENQNFFQRHKFGLGIGAGICVTVLCVILAGFGGYQILKMSGQVIVLGGHGMQEIEGSNLLDQDTVNKLNEIYEYVNIYYYEDFELSELRENLYYGLMEGLDDPYSVYYTQDEYKSMMESTTGSYYGIGAGLQQDVETMEVTIIKVYKGTPAEEAGLKDGDILVSVEGIDATSMEVSALVKHIKGEEGTTVDMVIYRESTGETLEFTVERRNVILPSVEGEMLEDGVGYIQITGFESNTDEQFKAMVEEFKAQGMKGMILDVRANPGGLLSTVVNMLDYILPEGTITYVEDTFGNRQTYRSDKNCIEMPIVVLTDENSASASEIFAGAIQDYEWGTLVGKTTFGKGIVQSIVTLSGGDAIKLTTAKYFTPLGRYIHGTGITPDMEVDYEYFGPAEESYDKQYDSQFLKGLEVLKEKMGN